MAYLIFFTLVCSWIGLVYPALKFHHERALVPEFAQWISKNTEENSVIIVTDEAGFIPYYGKRDILTRPCGDESNGFRVSPEELQAFKERVDDLLQRGLLADARRAESE